MKRTLSFLILAGLSVSAFAQAPQTTQQQQQVQRLGGDDAKKQEKPLTKEEQKKATQALELALGEARSLEPGAAAFAMAELAKGYARFDRAKAVEILGEAFNSAAAMPVGDEFKSTLQERILKQMLPLNRGKVEELLNQAEDKPKRNALIELARLDMNAKKFQAAEATIERIAGFSEFPYDVTTQLMLRLPQDQDQTRRQLFNEAVASYAGHEHKGFSIGSDDLAGMIVRFWRHLPPDSVMSGIDAILKEAKTKDDAQVTLNNHEGKQATFNSFYDYRLFELLPVIRELDASKAEDLLKQDQAVNGLLTQYPQGQQSLDPTMTDQMPAQGTRSGIGMGISSGKPGGGAPRGGSMVEAQAWAAKAQQIANGAAKDPEGALTGAMTLPVQVGFASPRRMALMEIANQTVKKDPGVARKAAAALIDAANASGDDVKASNRVNGIIEAARIYLRTDDPEDAEKTLDKAAKEANKAIAEDANADDPNQAPKGYWPSTAAWREIIQVGYKVSPDTATRLLKLVSDDEVRTLANVALATSIVGVKTGEVMTAVRSSKDHSTMISNNDEDDQ